MPDYIEFQPVDSSPEAWGLAINKQGIEGSLGSIALLEENKRLKEENERLKEQLESKQLDGLTGLMRRDTFKEDGEGVKVMRRALFEGRSLTLLSIDLVDFAKYNNVYGTNSGDAALNFFAASLKNVIRPEDVAVRWGGDEFIVVLVGAKEIDAEKVMNRLDSKLSNTPPTFNDRPLPHIGTRFGTSPLELNGRDFSDDEIMAAFDRASMFADPKGSEEN